MQVEFYGDTDIACAKSTLPDNALYSFEFSKELSFFIFLTSQSGPFMKTQWDTFITGHHFFISALSLERKEPCLSLRFSYIFLRPKCNYNKDMVSFVFDSSSALLLIQIAFLKIILTKPMSVLLGGYSHCNQGRYNINKLKRI